MMMHRVLDSDDEMEEVVSVLKTLGKKALHGSGKSVVSTTKSLEEIKTLLHIDAAIPIFDRRDMVAKVRECPKLLSVDARKGKMAADIEYSSARVEEDNRVLDELAYKAWCGGANFFMYEQRPRKTQHAKTNNSKVERAKKDEMIDQYISPVNVADTMQQYFPDIELENCKGVDFKSLYRLVDAKLVELEESDEDPDLREELEEIKSHMSKMREVHRTMALKRKERTSANYVITMPGPYPVNGQSWLKRALARTAVSATRKVKASCCQRCNELIASKEGLHSWYNKDGEYCQIIEDRMYVDNDFRGCDISPKMKLARGEFCVHAHEEMLEFAYGHQTERLPMMRFVRAEAMSYLNSKILADHRFNTWRFNAHLTSDNPFGIYFQPSSLLLTAQQASEDHASNLAVVGSLGDGYMLQPRRLFAGSFYEAMMTLAEGHLEGKLFIDDAIGAHEFLSGDVERVCEWIVDPDSDTDMGQNPIWWMVGLCEMVSSTVDGRQLLKDCGITVFDRDLCNLLYDYARSEINRREKDKKNKMTKLNKSKKSKVSVQDNVTFLSADPDESYMDEEPDSADEYYNNDRHDHHDDYDDYDDEYDGRRGGNSSDAFRQFQWWIHMNSQPENYTLLQTLVSESQTGQMEAHAAVMEQQMSSLSSDQANNLASSECIREVCATFHTSQTRLGGMLHWNFGESYEERRPIPTAHVRKYDEVTIMSTMRVDEEVKYSAAFLCDVVHRDTNLAVLHTRGFTPLNRDADFAQNMEVDDVYRAQIKERMVLNQMEDMRPTASNLTTVTARGVNGRYEQDESGLQTMQTGEHMRDARLQRKCGVHNQHQLAYTSTSERPCTMIVWRLMLPYAESDTPILSTMMNTEASVDGARFEQADGPVEPSMAPNSPLGVSFSSIHTIFDAYASHHRGRSLSLAGHVEWGQPLTTFDQLCKKPKKDRAKDVAKAGQWEEYSKKCYESKKSKSKVEEDETDKTSKTRRRACYESDAAIAKTTPPPFISYNDVRIERIGDVETETIMSCCAARNNSATRSHAPYAVTFQIPMQNAVRLIDKLSELKAQPGVEARHMLALMCVATIKALDTNELAKEKNAGLQDVMRKNARGAPVIDCNTELCCSLEEVYWGGINNLTATFDKTRRKGCYEWVSHGSGSMGADAGNRLSDQRKLGRSLHEGETTEEIYALQLQHFFTQVGNSMEFDTRPDALKFMPFGNVVGVTKSMDTYAESKALLESIAPVVTTCCKSSMLPMLLAFPLSPDTQSVAPLVNPGNFDCGSKLAMSTPRVDDFNPVGRADNVNATDELIALLNPQFFRPPSSQSSIDMAKTDMGDYGSTWKALHTLLTRITKELVPNYDTLGVHALHELVFKYRNGDKDLLSHERAIAATVLVLLNLCNPREFAVGKPVIVRMYAIVAAMAIWEDANGTPSEYGTLHYWRTTGRATGQLSNEEIEEEDQWFRGYFLNESAEQQGGAWGSVAPLYEAILARDGHHFQNYADARRFNECFVDALRKSVWHSSSPDGISPPPHVDGEIHPLENVKGPNEIRRRHLEPVYVGRTVRSARYDKPYVGTRGATFCVESFQATQILTLLTSAASIPLFDPNGMRGYGVQVYRNTGGMNVRVSVDANIQHWGAEPKSKKAKEGGPSVGGKRKLMWRSAKSTSVDQIDGDEIQNGTIKDRRESHALQRFAANHNVRALATTVSILKPPLPEEERMRGAEVADNKLPKQQPLEEIEALKKAIIDPRNLESMRVINGGPIKKWSEAVKEAKEARGMCDDPDESEDDEGEDDGRGCVVENVW